MADIQDNNYMINDLGSRKEEGFPGIVAKVTQDGNKFHFYCDNDVTLFVHIITDKLFRFRYAIDGRFPDDFSYAVEEGYPEKNNFIEFKEKIDHYRITTERVICTISKERLLVKLLDKSGTVLCEDEKGFHWENNFEFGGEIVKMSKKVQSGEHYYGLGDKACNSNLRGKRFELWGTDTYGYGKNSDPLYKNIPFYMGMHSKTSYGVFFDNTFRCFFDFACERSNVTSFWAQGGECNYYFFYGPEMLDIVEQYTTLTGKPELPPLWALGYHQCKWSYYPESLVREITKGFRDRKIPCDAIYLDIDYMEGFRCFTWSKQYFPNPKKMVADFRKDGFKTVVIIDPGIKIDKDYWVYQEALDKDYFCKRADGPLMKGSVWPGLCNFPDFTKPEVRDWWADLFKGLIAEDGVKGVWNDMNEPAVFEMGTFPMDVRHDFDGHPCSHRKAHNVYGMQMARATYYGVKKFSYPDRPFTITRSGYAGMQKYSSAWTGDNVASWEHMWLANIQCQRLSISGVSFVGSDIGGFIETPSGELYVRWLQLGAFHPFFRTHSSGDHGDQEPWSFGETYTELAKKAIELRYMILPYIYTTFWQYVTKGTPMLRPLVFLDQADSETYMRMAEFGFGDNMLVCPVTAPDVDGRWMYLPKGEWFYYWNDQKVAGGKEIWAEAPIDKIPIHIKAGSVIPNYPVMQYVGETILKEISLHVYHIDGEHSSVMYDDGGEGYGYEKGAFHVKNFKVKGGAESLKVSQTVEGNFKPTFDTYKIVLHGLPFDAKEVVVDGAKVKLKDAKFNDADVKEFSVSIDFKEISLTGKKEKDTEEK
jgi:alpha-glucosidase